jgi:hypothetical protein
MVRAIGFHGDVPGAKGEPLGNRQSGPVEGAQPCRYRVSMQDTDTDSVPQVPGVIEGHSWKFRAVLCVALSLVPFISLIAITAGNHGGYSRNLLIGQVTTSTCFVLLAVVAPYRLWETRRLDLTFDGITVHNFWWNWHIAWPDIADVVVTDGSNGVVTWYLPTVELEGGGVRKIHGLGSVNSKLNAQNAAEKLTTARGMFTDPGQHLEA